MRIYIKPPLFLVLLAIGISAVILAIDSYRHRFVRSDADLLALLPSGDATVFFANVSALRSTGMLNLLTGSKPVTDPEYLDFVSETHFDYSKNLDAIAGETMGDQVFIVLRGRFEWSELRRYAVNHGGSCEKKVCKVPASRAGRWASFFPIQPDVMALGLSPSASALEAIRPDGRRRALSQMPRQPVWVNISMRLLRNPAALPAPLRIFAISLESVDSVVLSLGRAAERSAAAFNVELDAACPSQATAEATRNQLEIQTKMLKLELVREHQQPNPADLTGLLTAGTFQVIDQHVIGEWPVRRELLNTLQ